MRLFCGFALAYEVRRNIELLLQHLKPLAPIQWSPSENLHITTKFIGEYPDQDLEKIKTVLAGLPKPGPMKIAVRGLGWFSHIFYAGIECPPLPDFAGSADHALAAVGVKLETHPYTPHLTLARFKGSTAVPLHNAVETLPSTDFGAFTATRHLLYRSRLTPKGSVYSVEAEFPLS